MTPSFSALEHEFHGGDDGSGAGQSPPRLDVLGPQGETLRSLELSDGVLTVGQAPGNQLVLEAEGVGRYHLRLNCAAARASVTDLGARGGTLLDDQPLAPNLETPFPGGATLRVGPFRLRLVQPQAAPGTSAAAAPNAISAGNLALAIAGGRETLEITPGQATVVALLLTNSGDEAASVLLALDGIPPQWVRLPEQAVTVQPASTVSLTIQVQAPREPASRTGEYLVSIRGRAQGSMEESCAVGARWTVLPFTGSTLEIRPRKRITRGMAATTYTLSIQNTGNQTESYSLHAGDDEPSLDYQLDQGRVNLEPGGSASVRMAVQARENPSGRQQNYNFSVQVRPTSSAPIVATGQLSQQRPFSIWLFPLAALVVLGLLGLTALAWELTRAGRAVANNNPQAGVTREATDELLGPTVGGRELSLEQALAGSQTAIAQVSQADSQATEVAAQIAAIRAEANPTISALAAALEQARAVIAQVAAGGGAGSPAGGSTSGGGSSGGGSSGGGSSDGGTSGGGGSSGGGSAAAPPAQPVATFTPLPTYTPFPTIAPSPTATATTPAGTTPTSQPPPPQSRIVFVTAPSTASTAGQPLNWSPAVQIQNQSTSQPITNYTGIVTLSFSADGCQQEPARTTNLRGTLQLSFSNGQALFNNVIIECAATYTIQAIVAGLSPAISDPFTVAAGPPAALIATFDQPPTASIPAETTLPAITVQLVDAFENQISSNADVTATLSPPDTSPNAIMTGTPSQQLVAGSATFANLSVDRIGKDYTVTFRSGSVSGSSPVFSIGAGQLQVTVRGAPFVATTSTISVTVSAVDAFGVVDQSFREQITLSLPATVGGTLSPAAGATLQGNASQGTLTFRNMSIDAAGSYTINAVSGRLTGSSDSFLVTANQLRFVTDPGNTPAGEPLAFTLEAGDGTTPDPNFSGSLCSFALKPNPPAAILTLGDGSTAVTGLMSSGQVTFTPAQDLHIRTPGTNYQINASCARSGGLEPLFADSRPFTITTSLARRLTISKPIVATREVASLAAETSFKVEVAALDRWGQATNTFSPTVDPAVVTLELLGGTLTDPNVGLQPVAPYARTTTATLNAGTVTFDNLQINRLGPGYSLRASIGGLSISTANFDITARRLEIINLPSTRRANDLLGSVIFRAVDSFDNIDPGFTNPMTITLVRNGVAATALRYTGLASDVFTSTRLITINNGIRILNDLAVDRVSLNDPYRLLAEAGSFTITSTQAFTITANQFRISDTLPNPPLVRAVRANSNLGTVTIRATDSYGEIDTTANGLVTISLRNGPPEAELRPGAGRSVIVELNQGTFDLTDLRINRLSLADADYVIEANSPLIGRGESEGFRITADRLEFSVLPPVNTMADTAFNVTIRATDGFTVDSNFDGQVTLSLSHGVVPGVVPGVLSPPANTSVPAAAGVASFSGLSIDRLGPSYQLTATAADLDSINSGQFNITANQLRFLNSPTNLFSFLGASYLFPVEVAATDGYGTIDRFTQPFTARIGIEEGPAGSVVSASDFNDPFLTIYEGIERPLFDVNINEIGRSFFYVYVNPPASPPAVNYRLNATCVGCALTTGRSERFAMPFP